jgi:hypothetical protein
MNANTESLPVQGLKYPDTTTALTSPGSCSMTHEIVRTIGLNKLSSITGEYICPI